MRLCSMAESAGSSSRRSSAEPSTTLRRWGTEVRMLPARSDDRPTGQAPVGSNPTRAIAKAQDRPVDGRVEEVTEQGLGRARALTCSWADKPPGPTGEGVAASQRRWQDCRKVKQLAPGPSDGNVSAPGCGEPIPPSISLGGRNVTASIRGREPRCVGSNPTGRLVSPCGRRAPASPARCNRVAIGCGDSTPPVRITSSSRAGVSVTRGSSDVHLLDICCL
jgi:hypothetical protein